MKRAAALLLSAVVVLVVLMSPGADWFVVQASTAQTPGNASVRQLNYELSDHRLRSIDAYHAALKGEPEGVDNIYLMGSSEFGTQIDQALPRFLTQRISDLDAYTSGRGGTASLYHAIELAAVSDQLPNNKVVLIVSPQWFVPEGTTPAAFGSVFSDSAWSAMLRNPNLTMDTRQKLISRAGALLPRLCTTRTRCTDLPSTVAETYLGAPHAALVTRSHRLRESYQGRRVAKQFTGRWQAAAGAVPIASIEWDQERAAAVAHARPLITNAYNMSDRWYERIKPRMWQLDGWASNQTFSVSPEYNDLRLFLEVARDTSTDVLLVSQPVNGAWYDFTGFRKDERQACYQKLRELAAEFHVQLADFSGNEYTPYYFFDNQHLGWKGWIDVDQAIYAFTKSA